MPGTIPGVLAPGYAQLALYANTWSSIPLESINTNPLNVIRDDTAKESHGLRAHRSTETFLNKVRGYQGRFIRALAIDPVLYRAMLDQADNMSEYRHWFDKQRRTLAWVSLDPMAAGVIDDLYQLETATRMLRKVLDRWTPGRANPMERFRPAGVQSHAKWLQETVLSRSLLARSIMGMTELERVQFFFADKERESLGVIGFRQAIEHYLR